MTTTNLTVIDRRSSGDEHDHTERLAHHFETMKQQYEAGKLGMWLFLATELLLFGGLFCAYAVYRGNRPDLFAWGSQFLDVKFGAMNTVVLIVSSLTMAMAVTYVQRGRRWPVIVALGLTFLCGVIFMAIKSVEYEHKFHENLVWGLKFYEIPDHVELAAEPGVGAAVAVGDPAIGVKLWNTTCRSCHGLAGEGITGQGRDIRASEFIQERDDSELVAYIKVGRMLSDPLNTTGIQMPPKGGNPLLKDNDLIDIIAYIRSFQVPVGQGGTDAGADEDTTSDEIEAEDSATASVPAPIAPDGQPAEDEFWIPESVIPAAPSGPAGLNLAVLAALETSPQPSETQATGPVHHSVDPDRPANAHLFFGFYFMLTGLHGLHVLAGMGMLAWLLFRTVWGHFGRAYYTPVDLGGLYWHIVDLIWIFLFPLFYLI